jgi:hypothetical protein
MRNVARLATVAAGLAACGPAGAQSSVMADVIGQTVMGMYAPAPAACYDGRWAPKPQDFEKAAARTDALIQQYREQGVAGGDLKKLFVSSKARWQLDAQPQSVRDLHDPWIARTARLERVALSVGNWRTTYHVQWRALAADGSPVGLYDAVVNVGGRFNSLDLYSPTATARPALDAPFCAEPGDINKWREAKAKREAEKAAKRAAKEAAKAS